MVVPLGYREIIDPSTKLKGVTQGRESGGMIIWYESEYTDSIELIKRGEFYISGERHIHLPHIHSRLKFVMTLCKDKSTVFNVSSFPKTHNT